jgi:hypothetical protein
MISVLAILKLNIDVNRKDMIGWGKKNPDVWCDTATIEIGVKNI